MALRDHWPERLKPYYIRYSYFVLLYCLPCFTVLVGLQRGGGVAVDLQRLHHPVFPGAADRLAQHLVMLLTGTALAS
jgi:hypothetical protein